MNKQRRSELNKIKTMLELLTVDLERIRDEEQEYLDNIPDNLQGGERYCSSEESIDNLCAAIDSLEETISSVEESM